MNVTTVIIVAVGLAMDAFAVSVATGATCRKPRMNHAFKMAFAFGSFQAIMPVIGWLAGLTLKNFLRHYDHWVAFALLTAVGSKMIYESFKIKKAQERAEPLSTAVLLILAVATSIDALAIGITFSFLLAASLAAAVVTIGVVTFAFSYSGFYIGKSIGHFFENRIEVAGAIVLIGMGVKILIEHLVANGA